MKAKLHFFLKVNKNETLVAKPFGTKFPKDKTFKLYRKSIKG